MGGVAPYLLTAMLPPFIVGVLTWRLDRGTRVAALAVGVVLSSCLLLMVYSLRHSGGT
jgi:hypothetical protein